MPAVERTAYCSTFRAERHAAKCQSKHTPCCGLERQQRLSINLLAGGSDHQQSDRRTRASEMSMPVAAASRTIVLQILDCSPACLHWSTIHTTIALNCVLSERACPKSRQLLPLPHHVNHLAACHLLRSHWSPRSLTRRGSCSIPLIFGWSNADFNARGDRSTS